MESVGVGVGVCVERDREEKRRVLCEHHMCRVVCELLLVMHYEDMPKQDKHHSPYPDVCVPVLRARRRRDVTPNAE